MLKKLIAIGAVIVLVAVGAFVYAFLRPPEDASGPIQAIPIETSPAETPQIQEPAAQATSTPTSEESVAQATATPEPEETSPPLAASAATAEPSAADSANSTAEPVVLEIVPEQSEARFLIDEVLRSQPTTVVGTTDQVAGQIAVTPDNLAETRVGVIQINARTLATDNDFRNRAIKNQILRTNEYEFVTFTPTQITGLPEEGTVGETYTFQISGDLTITDVTRPVTFDVTATVSSDTQIEGVATTTINYHDFSLFIPDSPSVDTVADDVRLELKFVAAAVS